MSSDQAKKIVKVVLDDLDGRSGFDHWWGGIDVDIQNEIRATLVGLVDGVLDAGTPTPKPVSIEPWMLRQGDVDG